MSEKTAVVQIAGIGLVTPYAWGREASWQQVLLNKSATRKLSLDLSRECREHTEKLCCVGAAFPDNPPTNELKYFSRSYRALMWAIDEALTDSGFNLEAVPSERIGCVIGSSKGDWDCLNHSFNEEECSKLFLAGWPHHFSSVVTNKYNLRGPSLAPVAACATGLLAIARGVELIEYGTCDAVIVGSVDCSIEPIYISSFRRLGVLNEDFEQPEQSLKPFDVNRNGFVLGEGAGALILIRKELADSITGNYGYWKSHHQLAEISDTIRMTPDSPTIPKLMDLLLQKAQLTADQIDYINLHGTGTRLNDLTESSAIQKIFQQNQHFYCNSFKGGMGHLLGAAGMVETALSLLAMRDNIIPATTNCQQQDPQIKIPLVTHSSHRQEINHLLKLSAGFGGHVIAGIISKNN